MNKTASQYGIKTTTIYTDPDAKSQHALISPFSVNLGDPSAYLDGNKIIRVAKEQGCVGIHPGYGFLSENSNFARNCSDAGLVFIGPPWTAIEAMGNKSRSKEIMIDAGVPCIPGYHGANQEPDFLFAEAKKIGFPVLIKAVKGGGGKGMRIAATPEIFHDQLRSAKSEAMSSFGDEVMLVEKYIQKPRHIEVQIFADKFGNCVALGERDCSIQRRHQKILEESPAPNLDNAIRQNLWEKARAAALAVGYEGAGTVEFILDNESDQFFFMEMNTRLQVEHPVTEMVTGEDLVKWQILVAEGKELPLNQATVESRILERGHAIEARIYAENPEMNFIPDSGRLVHLQTPRISDTVRVDAGFIRGDEVSSHYDPMIAKLIIHANTRELAIKRLFAALGEYEIAGVVTNIEFLKRVCINEAFISGDVETGFIEKHKDELFAPIDLTPETYAQAALGSILDTDAVSNQRSGRKSVPPSGFGSLGQSRTVFLHVKPPSPSEVTEEVPVQITCLSDDSFHVTIRDTVFQSVNAKYDPTSRTLTTFFPHTRLSTRFIKENSEITLFQHGQQYCLQSSKSSWVEKALGLKETAHSVLAPMPCKILRVEVNAGDEVKKDQALLVIESMKMETVIRSPKSGVVKRLVHEKGVSLSRCKRAVSLHAKRLKGYLQGRNSFD